MRKYLKPPFPRYHPPYPVLYAEVPPARRYTGPTTTQQLYGARLVNSPYMYDDPYTTVAVNDPYSSPKRTRRRIRRGAQNKTQNFNTESFFTGFIVAGLFILISKR